MNPPLERSWVGVRASLSALAAGVLIAGCGESTAVSTPVAPARQTGLAASCAVASPAQQFAAARLVFVGRMLPGPSASLDRPHVLGSPATVRVVRYLKGSSPRTVKVTTAVTITNRGVTVGEEGIEPQVGEIWKIYTDSRRQPFDTSICGGSKMIRSAVQVALELWNGFPVQARPRPIVPLGEGIVLDPSTGFPDDATKIAYLEDRFVLRAALPQGPSHARALPGDLSGRRLPPVADNRALTREHGPPAGGPRGAPRDRDFRDRSRRERSSGLAVLIQTRGKAGVGAGPRAARRIHASSASAIRSGGDR
jgi:hypothetical protein